VQYGGDAIMESLAFTFQAEMLQHGAHKSLHLRSIMPYAFVTDDVDESALPVEEGRQRDLRYKWHYLLLNVLSPKPNIATVRILNVILFACLCGSFVKGATPRFAPFADYEFKPTSALKVRDVDDSLPSRRLDALIRWAADYLESRSFTEISWEDAWSLVDQAHGAIWGNSIVDEIEKDMEHDRILLAQIAAISKGATSPDASSDAAKSLPHLAFADLLGIRARIFSAFKVNPVRFVKPLDFTALTDELGCAPLCYISPFGSDKPFVGTVPIITRRVLVPTSMVPEEKAGVADGDPANASAWCVDLVYSSLKMKTPDGFKDLELHQEAWASTLEVLAPLYKLSLYGLRYRTMLEVDMVDAVNTFRRSSPNIRWDPFYLRPDDVSSSKEYFHFYDLKKAQCDVCSKISTEQETLIVSAATLRRSKKFRDEQKTMHGEYADFMSLGRDWSPWLLCRQCHSAFVLEGTTTISLQDGLASAGAELDSQLNPAEPDDELSTNGLHNYLLSLTVDTDVTDADDLDKIDNDGLSISYFVSAVRRNFDQTLGLFHNKAYNQVLEIWNPWEGHPLLSPLNKNWVDKPYFRAAIRSIITCLFMSHAQIGQSGDAVFHAPIVVNLLSRIVPGSAISSEWNEDFPLTLEQSQIQDENFLVALKFASEWLSGWSPDVLVHFGVSKKMSQSVAKSVYRTTEVVRRVLEQLHC
jgi:hypothetical protein